MKIETKADSVLLPQSRFHWYKMGPCPFSTFPQWQASLSTNVEIGNYKLWITDFLVPLLKALNSLGPSPHCSSLPLAKMGDEFQFSSVTQSYPTPWTATRQASLSITNSQSLLKLMSIKSVMPSNHLILCRLLLLLLPSISPSIRVFSSELALPIRWPKYCSFSFNISPFNEYSGLISFRMDRFDLLAVQGTLRGVLQYHSSKASILRRSAFFIVQLSHPCVTTGKNQSFDQTDLCWQSNVSANF